MKKVLSVAGAVVLGAAVMGQGGQRQEVADAMGLDKGTTEILAGDYVLTLGNETGVAVNLRPKSERGFDFLPSDRLERRRGNQFVHLGDVSLRVRAVASGEWKEFTSYGSRAGVAMVGKRAGDLAAHELSATVGGGVPVKVVRRWREAGGRLQLVFEVTNTGSERVELGGFGMPIPFNNIIMERSLEEAHAVCSFTDPYIGGDAGFLRVTRLDGVGPTMVVTPVGKSPLEAWRLILEPLRPNQVFEGMMEWTVHTQAFAETEWKGVEQWVSPTSGSLRPGETRAYGVQFTPSPSIREIEDTLEELGRPVAVGLPGYIVPQDQTAKLFLKYGSAVRSVRVEPEGALTLMPNTEGKNGWRGYTVTPGEGAWGRSRVTLRYLDGTEQVVSYYVIKPAATTVGDLGRFLTTKAWFTDKDDPFGRAPSAISYDREADAQVVQDSRAWIAGLGDEGGSGNWLALAMKVYGQPKADEVEKFEAFVNEVVWGNLQFQEGPNAYGVRKSVFYYDPAKLPEFVYEERFNWTSWTSWDFAHSNDIGRGYNYPHVVAAYWSLYRVARNYPGLVKRQDWEWYLNQAYKSVEFMTSQDERGRDRVGYWRLGLMDGSIFVALLDDLKREGWTEQAKLVEERMKMRADRWKDEPFPFGSEMPWDSTGQEEVYMWTKRFGYEDKAQVTLNSILAYDPTVPHWGYNGNARRYWDFLYAGKLSRIERQIHHYGSGLSAIPLLNEYRERPDDLFLLRVGYAGTMGAISGIDEGGFASAAFHSFPSTLKWDAYSGDYGPNFFGHAFTTGAYLVETEDFGWQTFGGTAVFEDGVVTVVPQDSFRKRVYLASVGLYLTLDAGVIESVVFDPASGEVLLTVSGGAGGAEVARLLVESPVAGAKDYSLPRGFVRSAGAYRIPVGSGQVTVRLTPEK